MATVPRTGARCAVATVEGPFLKGWEVTTIGRAPNGDYLVGATASWYGPAVHRSGDLREWAQVVEGPAYDESSGNKLKRIWNFASAGETLYAAVAEAGLFRSEDSGTTWAPVPGLNEHRTRPGWQPGAGGLAAHRILVDPKNSDRMWVGISAVGVFRTDDGGATWIPRDEGVTRTSPVNEYDEVGFCIHCLVADPEDANTIWRQDHSGVYVTHDGADTWERIESGLPANFGFPIVRDPSTGWLFVVPLESDEYRMPVDGLFSVFRSKDGGTTWHSSGKGLAEGQSFTGILRDAMAVDGLDPCGIYLGTTGGVVHHSNDAGERWTMLPGQFPRISSVAVFGD